MPDDVQPRTVLAALVGASDRTHEEHVADFNRRAIRMGEPATLSVRQFERWLAGELTTRPVPLPVELPKHIGADQFTSYSGQ